MAASSLLPGAAHTTRPSPSWPVRRSAAVITVAQEIQNSPNLQDFLDAVREKKDQILQPAVDGFITSYLGLLTCELEKRLLGWSYEQLKRKEEALLKKVTVVYRFGPVSELSYLNDMVDVLQRYHYNDTQNFIMFLHGLTDDPSQERFGNISEAYLTKHINITALDAGPLLLNMYLRASSNARLVGERLGYKLAALAQHGLNPDRIHLVGHSLGSHVAGFAGKTFYDETGRKIGRITGLDPAGPCFSEMKPDLRLKASDAKFVDVIHTNAGNYGTKDTVGHVDYFPNNGRRQPSCSVLLCSHERAWLLYSASVLSPHLFPAIKCKDWEEFKNNKCSDEINYMGFRAEPTTGKFYLQTSGEFPYGLGEEGLKYKNRDGAE